MRGSQDLIIQVGQLGHSSSCPIGIVFLREVGQKLLVFPEKKEEEVKYLLGFLVFH